MSAAVRALSAVTAIGAATAAGAFLTFSTFTIGGLKRLAPAEGVAAMQSINRQATTPVFMAVLFGTGLACVALGVHAITDLDAPYAKHRLAASGIYLVGVIGLTVGFHVPRNDRLAAVDPTSAAGAAYWTTYLAQWVPMNHVRTLAPLATAALLVHALTFESD